MIVDAELAVIDLAMLGAAFLGGEDAELLVLRADRARRACAPPSIGTTRSFSPCSSRNGHSTFSATPSSVNFFDHSSAVALSGAPTTQRNWKVEEEARAGSATPWPVTKSYTLQCIAPNATQAA